MLDAMPCGMGIPISEDQRARMQLLASWKDSWSSVSCCMRDLAFLVFLDKVSRDGILFEYLSRLYP
jgi:hypothetical protein